MVRGPIILIAGTVVLLTTFGLLAGGVRTFGTVLPPQVQAALDRMMGPQLTGGPPFRAGDLASDYLEDGNDGLIARGPIAARTGNQPVFIDAVITGYTTNLTTDIPAEITTIRPILGCSLTAPGEASIVGHVTSGQSAVPLAMRTYNDRHLAAEVQVFVNDYRERGEESPFIGQGPAYEAYDVVITETRAPVFLVLETRFGNRIWNIHKAPDARIERVVLLGGAQAGVANLDPEVPVEVLLGDGLAVCGINPSYPLNGGHLLFQSMQNGAMSPEDAEEKLAAISAAVDAYDTWFRSRFGIAAAESRVGFDAGSVSVIGPVPGENDAKVAFAPMAGAKIRTTQDQFFEIAGQVADGIDFASRVKAIATTFAFGDLRTLVQGVRF